MKSLRFKGHSEIELIDVPEPSPGPGEVLIETKGSAICGSELHGYREDGQETGNSGHEGAGIVVAVGPGVDRPAVGDRVGVSAVAGCGSCAHCRDGRYTWCSARRVYCNMHAERFLAAALACHPLPDDLPWGEAVLLTGDGLGVPYHTSTRLRAPEIETIAVFGMGPVGLGNVLVQTHAGRRLIAVDIVADRLQLAQTLGAAAQVNAAETDPVERIRELTDGRGADVCIEAAGRPQTAKQCFAAVRNGGTVVFNGEQGPLPLSPSEDFIRRDITALGSWFYHFCEYPQMLALYRDGLAVSKLISHRLPLAEANTAFAMFAAGQTGKVILTP